MEDIKARSSQTILISTMDIDSFCYQEPPQRSLMLNPADEASWSPHHFVSSLRLQLLFQLRSVSRRLSCGYTLLSEIRMPQCFTIYESGTTLWCTLSSGSQVMTLTPHHGGHSPTDQCPVFQYPSHNCSFPLLGLCCHCALSLVHYYCTLLPLGPHFYISPLYQTFKENLRSIFPKLS